MRLILPGELAKHAISEGTKSVTKVGLSRESCKETNLTASDLVLQRRDQVRCWLSHFISFRCVVLYHTFAVAFHTSSCCIRLCGISKLIDMITPSCFGIVVECYTWATGEKDLTLTSSIEFIKRIILELQDVNSLERSVLGVESDRYHHPGFGFHTLINRILHSSIITSATWTVSSVTTSR